MANYTVPFGVASRGLATNSAVYNALLGKIFLADGVWYKVIKTSAALTSVAKQAALDSGTTTFNNTIAAVTSAATHRVAGLFPVGQVDLANGDFAMVVCGGMTTGVCGTATTAGNGLVTGASGRVTDTSGTYAANAFGQLVGVALQSQTTGNDVAIRVAYIA